MISGRHDCAMTPEEQRISEKAIEFANRNKKAIALELTDKDDIPPDEGAVSIFMAGSPGAGKTEASKSLIRQIGGTPIVRIDPDELRTRFEDYDGRNSWLFQPAAAILVERIHDYVLRNSDGTCMSI